MESYSSLCFPKPQKAHLDSTGTKQFSFQIRNPQAEKLRKEGGTDQAESFACQASDSYLVLKVTPQRPNVQVQVLKKLT